MQSLNATETRQKNHRRPFTNICPFQKLPTAFYKSIIVQQPHKINTAYRKTAAGAKIFAPAAVADAPRGAYSALIAFVFLFYAFGKEHRFVLLGKSVFQIKMIGGNALVGQ